jgi:cobalt-precorrin 5A hydrolase
MIVAGVGLSSRCTAEELLSLFEQARLAFGLSEGTVRIVATLPERAANPELNRFAALIGAGVVAPPIERMREAAACCLTLSERSANRFALPSVAECAALATAGSGARLCGPRLKSLQATLAIARPD